MKRLVPATVLILLLAAGCTAPPPAAQPTAAPAKPAAQAPAASKAAPAAQDKVLMQGFAFTPTQVTVRPSATVTWTNSDTAPHTVTAGTPGSPSGQFSSGNLAQGGTFSFTFPGAGRFTYFCSVHPSMTGTVTVE